MRKWGNGFPNHLPQTVFKSISTEHAQKFKDFKLKYLGPLEAIILVTILQYELAWQMLIH